MPTNANESLAVGPDATQPDDNNLDPHVSSLSWPSSNVEAGRSAFPNFGTRDSFMATVDPRTMMPFVQPSSPTVNFGNILQQSPGDRDNHERGNIGVSSPREHNRIQTLFSNSAPMPNQLGHPAGRNTSGPLNPGSVGSAGSLRDTRHTTYQRLGEASLRHPTTTTLEPFLDPGSVETGDGEQGVETIHGSRLLGPPLDSADPSQWTRSNRTLCETLIQQSPTASSAKSRAYFSWPGMSATALRKGR